MQATHSTHGTTHRQRGTAEEIQHCGPLQTCVVQQKSVTGSCATQYHLTQKMELKKQSQGSIVLQGASRCTPCHANLWQPFLNPSHWIYPFPPQSEPHMFPLYAHNQQAVLASHQAACTLLGCTDKACMLQGEHLTFLFIFLPGTLSNFPGPGIWAGAGAETPITPGGLWPAAAEATLPLLYILASVTGLHSLLRLHQSTQMCPGLQADFYHLIHNLWDIMHP